MYYPFIKILDFAGLAAATSLAGILNFSLLLWFLPRKGVAISIPLLLLSIFRIGLAAYFAFYLAQMLPVDFTAYLQGPLGRLLNIAVDFAAGAIAFLVFCYLLRARELDFLRNLISRRRDRP
jgi:peptidoglycan biosynthesis protein MviN/MurJ (putative lipid II flippase)